MFWKIAKVCMLLVVSAGIVAGCSKDQPQKVTVPAGSATDSQQSVRDGEALFKQYCATCHPNGGNVSDPKLTLNRSVLKSNHITAPDDIVRIMRNPLSRMIRFDVSTVSDKDARVIAEYILATFK